MLGMMLSGTLRCSSLGVYGKDQGIIYTPIYIAVPGGMTSGLAG